MKDSENLTQLLQLMQQVQASVEEQKNDLAKMFVAIDDFHRKAETSMQQIEDIHDMINRVAIEIKNLHHLSHIPEIATNSTQQTVFLGQLREGLLGHNRQLLEQNIRAGESGMRAQAVLVYITFVLCFLVCVIVVIAMMRDADKDIDLSKDRLKISAPYKNK